MQLCFLFAYFVKALGPLYVCLEHGEDLGRLPVTKGEFVGGFFGRLRVVSFRPIVIGHIVHPILLEEREHQSSHLLAIMWFDKPRAMLNPIGSRQCHGLPEACVG